jgi:hypothetical protein
MWETADQFCPCIPKELKKGTVEAIKKQLGLKGDNDV